MIMNSHLQSRSIVNVTILWKRWGRDVPGSVSTEHSLSFFQRPRKKVKIHAFGDASGNGVSSAVHVIVTQECETARFI